jgi:hypothetical protein
MFKRCLVYCSMCLEVPFIAPRQLGAIGAPFGKVIVAFYPWAHRRGNTVRFSSFSSEADRCSHGACGTPDSPVWLGDHWRSPRVARWLRCRPLVWVRQAHRTVRCTADSPVNYSCDALSFSRERSVRQESQPEHETLSGAHRTVRCTSGWCKSGWTQPHFFNPISLVLTRFLALSRMMFVPKTIY